MKADPKRSDRAVAKDVGVSKNTVAAVREKAEARGQIDHVATRTDTLGRAQPAAKPATIARPIAPGPPPGQKRAKAIIGFAMLLRSQTGETLDDLTRILRDEQRRIADIPLPRRIALGRSYLAALGLTLDDLKPV